MLRLLRNLLQVTKRVTLIFLGILTILDILRVCTGQRWEKCRGLAIHAGALPDVPLDERANRGPGPRSRGECQSGDIFSNLQFGAMGSFEARKAKWGTWVDAVYMALGTDIAKPSANVDANQGAYTFTGLRKLNEKVDIVFGARWNVLQPKIEFKGPLLTGTYEQTKQWVNPIVGFKVS